MSFDTATSWPPGLLTIFDHCRNRPTALENRYYGPFDKLLNYCFGSSFDFYVAPQNPPTKLSRDSIVFLVVRDRNDKPVLLVEIKDDGWAQKAELRYRADIQMRER
ncbi:uncharacterized protein LAESUDRAFT_720878 [Laetiporus sulphureus 93-53]|uniref:Fungal-type protein kinase domain-containing protein n=1 Tax=Laetiporus sulphureus 93-53 TaxID=1314785 RepID=A0A165HED9_9APHY|nr:uncharacterized protein LAESUDRAFT_720878 [Laetiporus sulphureus 93-53]KZT11627.1 hypothetical protein LAESUDRAFT_720878 [Laetiporus sulphureus 93-53]